MTHSCRLFQPQTTFAVPLERKTDDEGLSTDDPEAAAEAAGRPPRGGCRLERERLTLGVVVLVGL